MFTGNEDMEATALRERGWSISAIARHLGRDRKTVRAHSNGERVAGERRRGTPDAFDEYGPYLRARFKDDAHVWASALYDEVTALGFPLSYPSFTRGLRARELRRTARRARGCPGGPPSTSLTHRAKRPYVEFHIGSRHQVRRPVATAPRLLGAPPRGSAPECSAAGWPPRLPVPPRQPGAGG